MANKVTVKLDMEKDTKNTIRFKESVGPLDVPKLGTVYVPKPTVKEVGYEIGQQLHVDIYVK